MKMRTLPGSIQTVSKAMLCVAAALAIALVLAEDSRPAVASHTDIFFTQSLTSPSPMTSFMLLANDPTPRTFYIYARNVDDPEGLGAFEVNVNYVSWLVAVNAIAHDSTWLGSTGRTVACNPPTIEPNVETGAGHATIVCNTIGAPPPFGPPNGGTAASGLLGTITIKAGAVPAITQLILDPNRTILVDTGRIQGGELISPAVIPTTKRSLQLVMTDCGDVYPKPNRDGFVTISDVFAIAGRFGMTSTHPNWNPTYDLNDDGSVSLADVFAVAAQFGLHC